jgi:acetyl esterase
VLYPDDSTDAGRELRLKQEALLVSASLQDLIARHLAEGRALEQLGHGNAIHLNDTHPALAPAELMRLLVDEHNLAWDDAWATLRWLEGHGSQLGLDTQRIAIGGDSAGGTLAAATALRARDEGLLLALQLLITPGTSDRHDTGSRRLFGQGFLIDSATVTWFFDHAVPQAHRHDPRFAPLEAPDLEGVCPALVLLAECDPVVDDGIAYADRLRMAGVPVDLEIYRGVTHDFMKMGRVLPEAIQALDAAAFALNRAWKT